MLSLNEKTKVVNKYHEPYDIDIGRGTKWGNPFKWWEGDCLDLYRQYAKNNPEITNNLHELKGKRLGCTCKQPHHYVRCHGDILLEMIEMQYKRIVIGIDQSYTRTGISIAADGRLLKVSSINYRGCTIKSTKRKELAKVLTKVIELNKHKASEMVILCERIRTFSHGSKKQEPGAEPNAGMFISTNYIKATGALIAIIVDTAYEYGIEVYSADTRSWKSRIVGSSKKIKGDPKLATVMHVKKLGFDVSSLNKKQAVVYDDDAADSACIALYGFLPEKEQSLHKEE